MLVKENKIFCIDRFMLDIYFNSFNFIRISSFLGSNLLVDLLQWLTVGSNSRRSTLDIKNPASEATK